MQNRLDDLAQLRVDMLNDLFYFHRIMFEIRTGREFMLSRPDGNESHFKTVCRALEDAFYLRSTRLVINLPPGWAKSELCKSFIAWCFAHYPDCKFLYISHSFELATLHTASIKQTMCMPIYRQLFGIDIRRDSSAKDFFMTTRGGAVAAFGSGSGITGHDAGLPGLPRFSGAVVIDDIHKPEEIHSDTIRERVKRNYFETIERRLRAPNVPILLIGQRLHEDDLIAHLLSGADGQDWNKIIIKALDEAGNARYPEVNPKSQLLLMREKQPYVFASQYQQDPMPAGGGLFQESWFPLLDTTPDILATFVTCDSAETIKEYNDATVFSFWGIYNIAFRGNIHEDLFALHWIDCREIRIEPKDLEDEFLDFWSACMRYRIKPKFAAIEKKSTGVTLISTLKNTPGLRIIDVERAGTVNSKTNRFIEMQSFISNGQVSIPAQGKHAKMCLEHMRKITANDVHKFDDICDTAYDAVKIALIDKFKISKTLTGLDYNKVAKNLMSGYNQADRLRSKAYGR
jgi:predicted phage terminase large subunit-like protein